MVEQKVFSLVQQLLSETSIEGLETSALQSVNNVLESDMAMLHLRGPSTFDLAAQVGLDDLPKIFRHRLAEWEEQETLQEGRVLTWNVPEDYRGPRELNYANLGARQAMAFGLRGASGLVGHATFLFREREARDKQFSLLNNVGAVWGLQFERVRSEESRVTTEGIYRAIAENSLELILTVAPDGSYRYVSPSVTTILGYEPEEFMPFELKDWIFPDDLQGVLTIREELFNADTDLNTTRYRTLHKDGRIVWLETTGRAIRDPVTNELTEFQTSSRDVTDQVLAQEKLEASERLYRTVTENSSDVIQVFSANSELQYVSPSIKAVLQYEPEEFRTINVADVIHPVDRERIADLTAHAVASKLDSYSASARFRRKDGEYVWIESTVKFLRDENSGDLREIQTTGRDVTAQVVAKQKLEESEQLYRVITENSLDLIRRTAPDGTQRYVSPSVKSILGYEVEEFMTFKSSDWIDPDDIELIQQLRQEHFTGGREVAEARYRARHKDGRTLWFETISRSIHDPLTHEVIEIQTSTRDVTEQVLAQQNLEENERLYRLVTEGSNDLVVLLSVNNRLLYVSPSVKTILGYTTEEYMAIPVFEQFHPEDLPNLMNMIEHINASAEDAFTLSTRVKRKDGNYIWMENSINLLRNASTNEVTEIQVTGRDVSERVLEKQKLERSERLYRLLTEQSSNVIQLYSAQGDLRYISPSVKTILQYEPEELAAFAQTDLIHPDDLILTQEAFMQALTANQDTYRVQTRVRRKDGTYIWMDHAVKFIRDASSGEITETQTSSRDITDQVRSQQQLEASERQYRLISEHTNDLIQLFTANRELLYVSPAVRTILQYEPEEYLVTPPRTRLHPEDRERTQNLYKQALASKQDRFTFHARLERKDGTYVWLETSVRLIRDPHTDEVTEIQSSSRDISERVRAQEELSASERVFRRLFTDNPLPMWVIDRESLSFLEVNEAAVQKYGYSREEFLAMKTTDIRPAEDVPALTEYLARMGDGLQPTTVWRHLLKDNTIIHAEVSTYGMQHGDRPAFLTVIHDVTEQLHAELEMERLNDLLERRVRRLTALREIDRAIASSVDLQLTLGVVLSQLISQLGVAAAAISLLNPKTMMLEITSKVGFTKMKDEQKTLRLGEGVAGRAALERRQIEVHDLSDQAQPVRSREVLHEIEGFRTYLAVPLIAKGQVKGVLGVFHRTPTEVDEEWREFLTILAGQAAIAIDNLTLFDDLQRTNMDLRLAYDETIEGWSRALDLRDKETEGHSQRVTEITLRLAATLGMNADELVHVRRGALLHDIGKMGVPDGILLKPGKLTLEERLVIERHPDLAKELLAPIRFLGPALDIPYAHHEKWDGTGYPRGLKGEQIPLAARIFAVVDVWDALRSERPYREGWPESKVFEHIRRDSGSHFDPRVVEAFLEMMGQRVSP